MQIKCKHNLKLAALIFCLMVAMGCESSSTSANGDSSDPEQEKQVEAVENYAPYSIVNKTLTFTRGKNAYDEVFSDFSFSGTCLAKPYLTNIRDEAVIGKPTYTFARKNGTVALFTVKYTTKLVIQKNPMKYFMSSHDIVDTLTFLSPSGGTYSQSNEWDLTGASRNHRIFYEQNTFSLK